MELDKLREALTETILGALPQRHSNPDLDDFYRLIRNYPERGGKQLRGLFVLLSTEAHGGRWQDALGVAAALELFQNWVLIHDDIEDDSDERRGAPALHKQVGMPVALNVGDALHIYMWQVLNELPAKLPAEAIRKEFISMIHRTAEGQHLDLSWVSQNRFDLSEGDYLEMVTLKTAYYTVVSPLRLGALCAQVTPDEHFEKAGKALGVAFQIRDDVLNLKPTEDGAYGKEFAGDLYEAKRTLILAHLFSQVTQAETEELKERLGKPRHEKTEADISSVLELIGRYGSLNYAQSFAEEKAAEGLEPIRESLGGLANQLAAHKLTGLLESLARRHS